MKVLRKEDGLTQADRPFDVISLNSLDKAEHSKKKLAVRSLQYDLSVISFDLPVYSWPPDSKQPITKSRSSLVAYSACNTEFM